MSVAKVPAELTCPLRWLNTAGLSYFTNNPMPTPPQGSSSSLRACSQDALQLWLSTSVALLSFSTLPSCRGSGCCTYPVMNTAPDPHVHSSHSQGMWGEEPFLKRWGGEQVTLGQTWGRGGLGYPTPRQACAASSWSCSWLTHVCSFQHLAQLLGPVSCLLLSLVHLSTFLHTSWSIVDFRSLYALLGPRRPPLQPSSFPLEKDCAIFHISRSKGDFYPQMKLRCQLLKSHSPQLSTEALTPVATTSARG